MAPNRDSVPDHSASARCDCCEKPITGGGFHADDDCYVCAHCAVELLRRERDVALRDDNARLRAALEKISETDGGGFPKLGQIAAWGVARAALNGGEDA